MSEFKRIIEEDFPAIMAHLLYRVADLETELRRVDPNNALLK